MTHPQSPASPLPEAAEPQEWRHLKAYGYAPGNYMNKCHTCGKVVDCVDKRAITCRPCAEARHAAAPSPVAQAPAQAREVGAFEDWWYGHDGVRQRQVAYLGWPCTKELAESIWNGAREQAASSLPVALQQAREALAYHQAQTRPIDKTVDAIKAIDAAREALRAFLQR